MAYATVRLTGTFQRVDLTPGVGRVTIRPSRVLSAPDAGLILLGSVVADLDPSGRFEVELPATDAPNFGDPFTYSVVASMHHGQWSTSFLELPATLGVFDLADVPKTSVVEYVTRAQVESLLAAAGGTGAVTVSGVAPDSGLWINTYEEA